MRYHNILNALFPISLTAMVVYCIAQLISFLIINAVGKNYQCKENIIPMLCCGKKTGREREKTIEMHNTVYTVVE